MRAIPLAALVVASLVGPTWTCLAQSEPKDWPPQTLTGPSGSAGASSEMKTPDLTRDKSKSHSADQAGGQATDVPKDEKVRAAASTREAPGRVGALSPDEKRRAARARARAEAEDHAVARTPVRTAPDAPRPPVSPKTETVSAPPPANRAARVEHGPVGHDLKTSDHAATAAVPAPVTAPAGKNVRTASRGVVAPSVHARAASRRARINVAGRTPRVGDVVPPNVPLLPLPDDGRPYPGPRNHGDFAMDARREPWRYPSPPPAYPAYPYPRPYAVYGGAW